MLTQTELVRHIQVSAGDGTAVTVQNVFTDPVKNELTLYIRGGTGASWFRVGFDDIAPYQLWDCPSDSVYVVRRVYDITTRLG